MQNCILDVVPRGYDRPVRELTGIFLEKFFEIQCTDTVAATPVLSYFLFVTPITFPPLGLVAVAYVVET